MKKKDFLRMFLMVFIAMAGLTACSEEALEGIWPPMEWQTDVNMGKGHTISVPAEGGTYQFTCTNYEGFWLSPTYNQDEQLIGPIPPDFDHIAWEWVSVEVKKNVMTVVISPNESGTPRSIKIDTTAGDIFDHFTFNQAK